MRVYHNYCEVISPNMLGIIYNPVTNGGKSADRMRQIRELMDSKGIEYDYRETEKEAQATELAKELSAKCDSHADLIRMPRKSLQSLFLRRRPLWKLF